MKTSNRKERIMRAQIHPRLPADVTKRVRTFAAAKGSSQSSVIEAALASYLDDSGERAVILRRLDRLSRAIRKVNRDVTIVADALSIFIQVWLVQTNRIPDHERVRAEQNAEKRFAHFKEQLAGRMATGRSFIGDLVREGRIAGDDVMDEPDPSAGGGR
jgi:hypothetical protein